MCSIFGALFGGGSHVLESAINTDHTEALAVLFEESEERGRDTWGLTQLPWDMSDPVTKKGDAAGSSNAMVLPNLVKSTVIGTRRGEPAHEWVLNPSLDDMHPFTHADWTIVHNGTISNDQEIIDEFNAGTEEGLPFKPPTRIDSYVIAMAFQMWGFQAGLARLQGSFAILAVNRHQPDKMWYATNYKPLFMLGSTHGDRVLFASQKAYLMGLVENPLLDPSPVELGPYRAGYVQGVEHQHWSLYERPKRPRTLVVCSGGLDSGTVAWLHHRTGNHVDLLHFQYGTRSEKHEVRAVESLANAMEGEGVNDPKVHYVKMDFFTEHADSPLTDGVTEIAQGQEGAEFAHEWVPARNTVMLALAVAYAEKHGYDTIALGSNQEESCGGYPDNEQEFVNKWRDLIPYAVKPYTRVRFSDPLAGAMKHDIVQLGASQGMPFEHTWSCYKNGDVHCGDCGPCSMRKIAFRMAKVEDPTEYAVDKF